MLKLLIIKLLADDLLRYATKHDNHSIADNAIIIQDSVKEIEKVVVEIESKLARNK